jgi:aspartate/methionine/tyrosine aminotransferase
MIKDYDIYSGAKRLDRMFISPIRAVLDKAKAMEDQGKNVIRLLAGEPDFQTPEDIKEATVRAIRANFTRYGSNRGQPRLRKAIARILGEDCCVTYDPEEEIIVTSSGAEAINNALMAFIDPGDEVILFTPAFVSYENMVYMCGGKAAAIPLKLENGFNIDLEEVEANITGKTKMIVINNPCNPTGAVYPRAVLEGLSCLAQKHNLLVFSDEIYSRLTYSGPFCSMASLPGMKERTIVMNGFSKTYAMTGWRLGYLAADKRLISRIMKIHQYSTTCSPTFIQEGLADALFTPGTIEAVDKMIGEFALRRYAITKGLEKIPGLHFSNPEGAFYVFVNVANTGLDGDTFTSRLLDEKLVATVPGAALGKGCGDFVRLSFAASMENIALGLDRIGEFVAEL